MQIKFIVPGAAVVFAACLNAAVASEQERQERQYLGPSSIARQGNQGNFTYQDDCAEAFKGSTWCTSEQIIVGGPSTTAPLPEADGEWVIPVPRISRATARNPVDFSGAAATAPGGLSCGGWSNPSSTGLIFFSGPAPGLARFTVAACSVPRFAACCGRLRDESDD